MRRTWNFAAAVLVMALVCPSGALAQSVSATTGSINGRVVDGSGAALPGVTIEAASPSMQGVRTTVSSQDGSFRIPAVPPGEYIITFNLPGFATVSREGVRITLGFTATLNIVMQVAALQETVTVTGASPVVDVTSTTSVTSFGAERLAALPNARDFWTILAASPAIQVARIDVAGSAAGTQTPYSAYDTKSDQHRPMMEGIVNTEGTGGAGFYYDYGSIEEVAINAGGNTAEMPWPGVWSNFITKSGGNTYSGRIYGDYQNKGIQARNIDDDRTELCPGGRCGNLQPSDLNRMESYHDLNADVGGYLKKDKLWWYFSVRDQNIKSQLPNFPVKPFETGLRNLTGKGTWAVSPNNKLTFFAMGGRKVQPNRMDTFRIGALTARHETEESTWRQQYWGRTLKGGWDSVLSDAMFIEVRGGQFFYDWPNFRSTEAPAFQDVGNNLVRGGNRDGWHNIRGRNQVLGSLSYYKDNWGGTHNFKVGGEVFRETATFVRGDGVDGSVPGDVLHVLNNGAPAEVYLFQSPSRSENGLKTLGMFAQDTWQAGRFTVNFGVRYDRYLTFTPAQEGPPVGRFNTTQVTFPAIDNLVTFNAVAPRFGIVYDLTGGGRTVLKFNVGNYWWNPGTGISQDINPNSPDWFQRYAWADRNASGLWDPGEEGVLIDRRGGAGSVRLDPDLEQQYTREIATFLQHELLPGFALHAGYVYRSIGNLNVSVNVNRPLSAYNVPTTIRDPGEDGRLGTADDGANIPGFNLDPANLLLPVLNTRTNLPGEAEFHTIEYSATRRQADNWSLAASGSIRLNRDHENVYFGNNLRSQDAPSTMNDFINTDDGRYVFTTWTFKLNGSYRTKWDITLTPALRVQAGQPFGRTFLATSAHGINYGSQRILAEPIDSRRQDNIVVLDTRVEKAFRLKGTQRLSGFFDIYNISNSDAASNITWSSGGGFLRPSTIIGPRIMRFGVKYDW
ncbi:MAG TPA: carboxypeptidase regulatory-like domain-containing protein [Vicinamibacterales bacterium]|nr:carboxypeptidase regulatory-like domain-containing protein [Vicinamibacterales bacterium]